MSDTARVADDSDRGPAVTAAVPTVGTVLAVVAFVALAVPARSGPSTSEVALPAAAAAALVAVGAFLARRHDLAARRIAAPIATGSSLFAVVLSGYAITQGALGSVTVPGLEWSVSLLFLAFFVAAGAVGIGVADYVGITERGLFDRTKRLLEMTFLGGMGLVGITAAAVLLALPVQLVAGELTEFQWTVVEYLAFAVGLGAVSVGYLAARERELSYIDLERPTLRTVGWIGIGLVLLLGSNMVISWLMTAAGIEGADHTTTQQAAENPELLLVILPAMILVVGPFEELLYRNVIQKSLYETFSRKGAVVVASVVFTLVHVTAYATAGAGQLLASLSILFVLSLILGHIYERTENLLVPALAHGCYNAVIFLPLLV
ncbi:CPBP family intramembrane glutamic endopeptidase [Natronolimnohabitans sp. A-GB9]|uniref:CPBP family intramembrane glutamic endopeptidase n=1 Tax=Natronolimnohabitans sp. A-GB9 TaxID=3069757 RepID=UPI0027B4ED6C|nr:CPBP family intramembrane glutamic endopeptidase [Natronolimnohabitans sp. A-GB9]MDQ2049965.1 CPBP family intramembrane glutamic endopeptidase [Natronolimnohabitans sp. A-GB9]